MCVVNDSDKSKVTPRNFALCDRNDDDIEILS